MGQENPRLTVYTCQTDAIASHILSGGTHYAKMEFIKEKYGEVAPVFTQAYHWYVTHAEKIVPRPAEAESAIWAFLDPKYLDIHPQHQLLTLEISPDNAIFFSMSDWNCILNLSPITASQEEADVFQQTLAQTGISYGGDVFRTPYYPQLRKMVLETWERLFIYDAQVKSGNWEHLPPDIQVGLWSISPEDIKKTL